MAIGPVMTIGPVAIAKVQAKTNIRTAKFKVIATNIAAMDIVSVSSLAMMAWPGISNLPLAWSGISNLPLAWSGISNLPLAWSGISNLPLATIAIAVARPAGSVVRPCGCDIADCDCK